MNETEKIIEPSKLAKSDNIYSAKRTTEILPKNIYDQFEFAVGNTNPITYAVRIIRFPVAGKKVLKIEIGKLQTTSKGLLKTTPLNINNYFTKFLDTIVSILDDVINDPLIQRFQGILISFDKSIYESITTRAKFQNTLLKMSRRLYKIYSYVIELDEKHNMYALYKKNLSFDAVFDEDYIINTLTDIGSIDWSGADNSQKTASTNKEEPSKIVTPKSKIKTPDISVGAPLDNEKIISNVSNALNTKINTEVIKPVQPPQPKEIGTFKKTLSERLNSQQTMDSPAGKAALKFFCMSDLFSEETNKLFSMTEEELSSAIWFKNKHKEKLIDYLENDFLIMPVIHYLWSEGFEYTEYRKNTSVSFSSPYHMIRKIAAKHPLKILDEPKKLTKQNAEKILFNLSGLDKFLETTKDWLDSGAAIIPYHTYINTRGIDNIKGINFKSFYNNYRTGKNQIFEDLELEKDKIKNIIDDLTAEIPASEMTNLERSTYSGSVSIGDSIGKVTYGSDLQDLFEIFKEKADIEEIIKINNKLPLAVKDRWLVDDPDIFEEKFIKDWLDGPLGIIVANIATPKLEVNNELDSYYERSGVYYDKKVYNKLYTHDKAVSNFEKLYKKSQEFFKEQFKDRDTITLYRGVGYPTVRYYVPSSLESWSTSISVATNFATDSAEGNGFDKGIVLTADIPLKHIFGSYLSLHKFFPQSSSYMEEKEYIVMGGTFSTTQLFNYEEIEKGTDSNPIPPRITESYSFAKWFLENMINEKENEKQPIKIITPKSKGFKKIVDADSTAYGYDKDEYRLHGSLEKKKKK